MSLGLLLQKQLKKAPQSPVAHGLLGINLKPSIEVNSMYSIQEINDNTFIVLLDGSQITPDTFVSADDAKAYIDGLNGSQDD